MKTAYIWDIDGVLANSELRDQFQDEVARGDFSWFQARLPSFACMPWAVQMVQALSHYHTIIFLTARDERYRLLTVGWIERNVGIKNYKLIMRHKAGDDTTIKKELYHDKIEGKYNVLAAIDDKHDICTMWRSLGITALCNTEATCL